MTCVVCEADIFPEVPTLPVRQIISFCCLGALCSKCFDDTANTATRPTCPLCKNPVEPLDLTPIPDDYLMKRLKKVIAAVQTDLGNLQRAETQIISNHHVFVRDILEARCQKHSNNTRISDAVDKIVKNVQKDFDNLFDYYEITINRRTAQLSRLNQLISTTISTKALTVVENWIEPTPIKTSNYRSTVLWRHPYGFCCKAYPESKIKDEFFLIPRLFVKTRLDYSDISYVDANGNTRAVDFIGRTGQVVYEADQTTSKAIKFSIDNPDVSVCVPMQVDTVTYYAIMTPNELYVWSVTIPKSPPVEKPPGGRRAPRQRRNRKNYVNIGTDKAILRFNEIPTGFCFYIRDDRPIFVLVKKPGTISCYDLGTHEEVITHCVEQTDVHYLGRDNELIYLRNIDNKIFTFNLDTSEQLPVVIHSDIDPGNITCLLSLPGRLLADFTEGLVKDIFTGEELPKLHIGSSAACPTFSCDDYGY